MSNTSRQLGRIKYFSFLKLKSYMVLFSSDDCLIWKNDTTINPITKRKIKTSGKIFGELNKACAITAEHCRSWKSKENINPITKRKLIKGSGFFQQIAKICDATNKLPTKNPVSELKNVTGPILNKGIKTSDMVLFSNDDCLIWKNDTTINPITKRKIKTSGKIFGELNKACAITAEHCRSWKSKENINPITKRKLIKGSGFFQQIAKICEATHKLPPKNPLDELKRAMKNVIGPILNKGDTINARIKFYELMTRYLHDILPCFNEIEEDNKTILVLMNSKGEPLIKLEKRIGSDSVYGIAYLTVGKGVNSILKFSCKVMPMLGNEREIEALEIMTYAVLNHICPNMPIVYKSLSCKKNCTLKSCPPIVKNMTYFIVINELADYDMRNWFYKGRSREQYESVIIQLILSVYCFHNMGFLHNDCHLQNFLIHKIKPGGFWRYKIHDIDIYVPNCGFLLVLFDPGLATNKKSIIKAKIPPNPRDVYMKTGIEDFKRPLSLMTSLSWRDLYKNCIPMSKKLNDSVSKIQDFIFNYTDQATDWIDQGGLAERNCMCDLFRSLSTEFQFNSIVVNKTPPDFVLNVKPYFLKK